ncbi:MAG: sugar phosphate nucleotidyltransferase [Pyrinomonadaceae bacterium]
MVRFYMRSMILAAGLSTRLWPLTIDRAKAAIPLLGKPLICYVAEYLASHGSTELVVNLHHQPESVREALGNGSHIGVNVNYVEEPQILGTSGALINARALIGDETFVVINGKIYTDIDLAAVLETHRRSEALATIVLMRNYACEPFSEVNTKNGLVTGFGPMPDPTKYISGSTFPLVFTGIHIMEPRIFDYIPKGKFSHTTTDVYPPAIARGERIAAHVAEGIWYELSTIPRYLSASLALLNNIQSSPETVYAGLGSEISDDAIINNSVIWNGAVIESGANIRNAVLGDGVRIEEGTRIENSVVVRAEVVRAEVVRAELLNANGSEALKKVQRGDFHGLNFIVPFAQ